ncbi:RsmE family RNA methyltransferase [Magnetofaba australis]|uniref:RsmE family RNA methyltransferase n=1 Tax=Magnetofaba australis TaxID=1472297 RepID=UPI001301CB5C|nr:RsmE family RNA methyltransferase [Magnetofaba australis]
MIRLLETPVPGVESVLPIATAAALDIWRARPGDILTVCAADGTFHRGRLLDNGAQVRVFEPLIPAPEPPAPRRLIQCLPNRERMRWIVEKAVEFGATELIPLACDKAYVGEQAPKQDKSATWSRVALEAARQCRRATVPPVRTPQTLADLLAARDADEIWFMLDRDESQPLGVLAADLRHQPLSILVGPEGGWSVEERAVLRAAGAVTVRVGARVLRTESAGLAVLATLAAFET